MTETSNHIQKPDFSGERPPWRASIPFGELSTDNSTSKTEEKAKLDTELDAFFEAISFASEKEAILPQNAEKTKTAFKNLCEKMGWVLTAQSFEELLEEKSGHNAYRKDGVTPNFYHEIRQIIPLLSMIRSGHLDIQTLNTYGGAKNKDGSDALEYGGLEALLCTALRHDSYEDFGKSPHDLYASLEKRLHKLNSEGKIDDNQLRALRYQASYATALVKLLSSKTKRFEEVAEAPQPAWKKMLSRAWDYAQGKKPDLRAPIAMVKREFFDQNINRYYAGTLRHPFSFLLKITDSIEGLSTRIVPHGSKMEFKGDNAEYNRIKRIMYGQANLSGEAYRKWKDLYCAIAILDSALETNLLLSEHVDAYHPASRELNGYDTSPMRLTPGTEAAVAYLYAPKCWTSHEIFIERLEEKAISDMKKGNYNLAALLERSVYPSFIHAGLIDQNRAEKLLPETLIKDSPHEQSPRDFSPQA